MVLWGLAIGEIEDWEAMLFQLPFVFPSFQRRGSRQNYEHYGRPFLGPDGLILQLEDHSLEGDGSSGIADSGLDNSGIATPQTMRTGSGYISTLVVQLIT